MFLSAPKNHSNLRFRAQKVILSSTESGLEWLGCWMIQERVKLLDPLEFIRGCVAQKKIFWTYHVNMRMRGRFIPREIILASYENYEIIEEYPGDKYLPSYLIYSEYQGEQIHILFAIDTAGDNVRIITAYRPSPEDWEEDLKTRRGLP